MRDAVPALRRYLSVEFDSQRAVEAAVALLRLGGEEAEEAVRGSVDRYGPAFRQAAQAFLSDLVASSADPVSAPEWLARGLELNERGQWHEAHASLSRALELDPKGPASWAARAIASLNLREFEAADADAEQALARDKRDYDARVVTAEVALRDLRENALEATEAFSKLYPERAEPWLYRAHALAQVRDLEDAQRALAQADRLLESPTSHRLVISALLKGLTGDAEGEVADLRLAVEIDPTNAFAWRDLGCALHSSGGLAAAQEAFTQGIEAEGGDSVIYSDRAYTRQALGDLAGSLEDATRAVRGHPQMALARVNLATTLELLGRDEEALEQFEAFLLLIDEPGRQRGMYLVSERHPAIGYARSRVASLAADGQ